MNYWHMQLEPGESKLSDQEVKSFLKQNIIGMGTWDEKSNQQVDFQKRMQIGDIVLVKSGQTAIGLVQVTSDYFENNNEAFWFNRRRGVEILEVLNEPRNDFPQPMGTLSIASGKNTPTYQYIDQWYQSIKIKKKTQLTDVRQLHQNFMKMKSDTNFLLEIINNIEKSDIRQLSYIYEAEYPKIENKPVVYLRKKIIDYLKENSIDADTIQSFKQEISQNFSKNVFRSWGELFRILYSIYFAKYKNELEAYLQHFIELIQKKLNIQHITKYNFVHFDGAQNQGNDSVWFAIYNKTYKSQKHAYQLFLSIKDNKFHYGLLHKDLVLENEVLEANELCFKDLILKFKAHLEKIINDDSKEKAMITEKADLLAYQKQIILQGPPGTGKTRLAKQIARYIIKNEMEPNIEDIKEQVRLVQFHPSYSYEDFIRGIVAKSNGSSIEYKTENKLLVNIANDALRSPEKKYILIIDEINRANLSSVLGELIYALEYRDEAVESMYDIDGDRKITLPSNLYIIGTMNTADRSIGHIDYAIRRRFTFIDVLSNENNILSVYPNGEMIYTKTIQLFSEQYVSTEFNIDDIKIGHSYFIANDDNKDELQNKLEYQVKPLLREYVKDGILNNDALKIINELKIESNS